VAGAGDADSTGKQASPSTSTFVPLPDLLWLPPVPFSLDNVCSTLPKIACKQRVQCCEWTRIGFSEDACEERERADCESRTDEVRRGLRVFNAGMLYRCLSIRQRYLDRCGLDAAEAAQASADLKVCDDAFASIAGETALGSMVVDTASQSSSAGVANDPGCDPTAPVLESGCAPGFRCDEARSCVRAKIGGDPCTDGSECSWGVCQEGRCADRPFVDAAQCGVGDTT
jgi:hypothetical protein